MKIKNKKKLLVCLIIFLLCFVSLAAGKLKNLVGHDSKVITSKYPNGYITETVSLGNIMVGYTSQNMKIFGYSDALPEIQNPSNVFLVKNNKEVKQNNEISFSSGGIPYNILFRPFDIDNDGQKEIISEWGQNAGGSSGARGLTIWKLVPKDNLLVYSGFPAAIGGDSGSKLEIRSYTGSVVSLPTVSTNSFIEYNYQYPFRLNYARFIWGENECHICPHIWGLRVFLFEGGSFIPDKTWNEGKEYLTKEKISMDEEGYNKIERMFAVIEKT